MREFERGKHGEVSGLAGRRNKGERDGGFAQGVWRGKYWDSRSYERNHTFSIFVDRLPESISKRELYKAFGKFGFISDIFISRKARQRSQGPFAFIRYVAHGGAMKAVEMMNNKQWGKERLLVTISKYRQRVVTERGRQSESAVNATKRRIAEWDVDQKQRLQRSLLGVCVKPIELRKIMYFLLEEWKGPRAIEVRDVGPYRCLITFSSSEIRDEAVESQLLLSVFDEVRFHWDIFWSLLRRVWIEITGIPIGLWDVKNFTKIAELWGKVIRFDDRAEEAKSFSTTRIQIDSFQWERIHEWVNVTVDDRHFEVFVKDFGSEIYSIQSHPDRVEGDSDWSEEVEGSSLRKAPAEVEEALTSPNSNNSKLIYVEDPIINAINCPLNVGSDKGDENDVNGVSITKGQNEPCLENQRVVESTGFGLGNCCEAQLVLTEDRTAEGMKQTGGPDVGSEVQNWADGSGQAAGSDSTRTCPFPLGFGPCASGQHIHRQCRAPKQTYSQVVRNTLPSEPDENSSNCKSKHCRASVSVELIAGGVENNTVADSKEVDGAQVPDEQRDGGLLTAGVDDNEEGIRWNNVEDEEPSIDSEERSDETLYKLAEKAIRGVADSVETQNNKEDIGFLGDVDWRELTEEGTNDEIHIGETEEGGGEYTLLEAAESKRLWDRTGIFFDSSEEEDVVEKLVNRKLKKKERAELRQRKQSQGRKVPCIQGKTLATRMLRKNCIDFLGVSETKKAEFDNNLIFKVWGGRDGVEWDYIEAVNAAGIESEIQKVDILTEEGNANECVMARGRTLRILADRWYERKACYWKQISKSNFANLMDRNTKFFHGIAKSRKRRKEIEVMKVDGRIYRGKERILNETWRYFRKLYTEDNFLTVKLAAERSMTERLLLVRLWIG
ncbi:hypothetical protein PIB30_013735 [Stylosanthes scabra]|uniref:RRM domain-containing protein n=1 Tax=Stylosanthes scabra TaxID=79078 RepID=A0ABU6Y8D7_9FABA|nr:hypothetical protein [Stylosanthes scabra]